MTLACVSTQLAERFPLLRGNIAPHYDDLDYELAMEKRATRRHARLLSALAKKAPRVRNYLNGSLHDSSILNCRRSSNQLQLVLDDFSTHCLFDVLAGCLKLTRHSCFKKAAPLEIVFVGLKAISAFRIADSHNRATRVRVKINPGWTWINSDFEFVNKTGFGLGVSFQSKRGQWYLVALECQQIRFVEKQRSAFIKHFGTRRLGIFDKYWKARRHRAFDCSNVSDFIK